jgi:hypothetical protein
VSGRDSPGPLSRNQRTDPLRRAEITSLGGRLFPSARQAATVLRRREATAGCRQQESGEFPVLDSEGSCFRDALSADTFKGASDGIAQRKRGFVLYMATSLVD